MDKLNPSHMSSVSQIDDWHTELPQIVTDVFGTMLDADVSETEVGWDPEWKPVLGIVQLSGSWKGAVCFQCSTKQATQFTQQIMQGECSCMTDEMRDFVGELANVITGNIKCLLPRGVYASLPVVMFGTEESVGGSHVWAGSFRISGGEMFRVALRRMDEPEHLRKLPQILNAAKADGGHERLPWHVLMQT